MPPERAFDDYSPSVTAASKAVLLELMTLLRSYREALVLVGGWVPYFLLETHRLPGNTFTHVGSIDVDLAVDPAKVGQNEYATIVELLKKKGYAPAPDRAGNPIPFSFERMVVSDFDQKSYTIRVDFLTHAPDLRAGKHRHLPVQPDLLARKTKGAEAAFLHFTTFSLSGTLPGGRGQITVPLRMADVVGCLAMKGIVLGERFREKDAYDIYALVAHYKNGPRDVVEAVKPYLREPLVKEALANIRFAFATREANGPAWVTAFLPPASSPEYERITTDVFMVVQEFIKELS
jgi:hypothetical protein